MIQVTVTCDTGRTWETSFNGEHRDAVKYFLGQSFTEEDVATGRETAHRVIRVESNPIA